MLTIASIIPQPFLNVLDDILTFWEGVTGSWGVAIILLTFTIRILILPLTFRSVKSMQKLQVLQPEIKKIQARYKEDRKRMNEEMMKFYQENKVNPLGSCLPLLLQIPFFIALFQLLRSPGFKADIAGNESFLFIPDLAAPLTGYPFRLAILIVLYVGTQLIASLITQVPGGDKTQQRIMLALPFVFTIFIINFEAGLIVYWITTNVWTIGQQLVVRKMYPRPALVDEKEEAAVLATHVPARGKPARTDGGDGKGQGADSKPAKAKSGKAKAKSGEKTGGNGSNGGKPPPSPRRKKKRSGRRR